ncbi:MAG: NADPH:quinone oxidoreductase family protein [Deltaproteobacteria bacterium]|nr:NADPH:quinone oxidoreductase family protein [Deltaproteobacteria bacterium]MBW1924011.1 NADPH:quinone oxidoreductase family protein [Deltaproteobacteria bacterium]MBW2348354.1 NADPH:quinone oxidoreductase family protein [Deltaproteobacteria bacterium]
MKAIWVREFTDYRNLALEDVAPPELHPGQVRIDVRATGVSFAVSLWVSGKYQRKPPLPFAPGTEAAGVITEVTPGVSKFRPGDRVTAALDWGGMAEEAVADAVNVHPIPADMDFDQAIALPNSYATVCAAFTWPHLLHVKAGQKVLVHGCAGGIGLAAVEIGKILGATVIGTASSDEKIAAAKAHGADHVINYKRDDFKDRVLELTEGVGVDVVVDPVGGEVFGRSLRCLAPEGRIMPVGFAGGTIPQIPANLLLVKNITVCGLSFGYYHGWGIKDARYECEDRVRAIMNRLCRWYGEGKIRPHISHRFPLEKFKEAMATVLERKSIGRVALVQGAGIEGL